MAKTWSLDVKVYQRKMMMLGKGQLSGLWEPGTRLPSLTSSPVSLSVSLFFWPHDCSCRWQIAGLVRFPTQDRRPAERQRARTKKMLVLSAQGLWNFMPVWPTLCDLGASGWGELCFPLLYGDVTSWFCSSNCCFSPYQSFQWCNRHLGQYVTLPFVGACSCWFGICFCGFLVCCCFCLVCFSLVLLIWLALWWPHWTVYLVLLRHQFLVHSCLKNEHNYNCFN